MGSVVPRDAESALLGGISFVSVSRSSTILYVGLILLAFSASVPFSFGIDYQDISTLILLSLLPTTLGLVMCSIAYAIDRRPSSDHHHSRRLLLVPSILAVSWGIFLSWSGYLGYIEISGLLRTSVDQAERSVRAAQLVGNQVQIIDGILLLLTGVLLFLYSHESK